MGPLAAGQVVLLPFPFSDLSRSKLRPVLLLAHAGRTDWIACQITRNPYGDNSAIELTEAAFVEGSLERTSYARPGKLFTAHESLITAWAGTISTSPLDQVKAGLIALLHEG